MVAALGSDGAPQVQGLPVGDLDGATVGVGGFILHNHPMELIRRLLRIEPKGLRVVFGPSAGPEVDLLIAAGVVKEVVTSYVGAEGMASVCPIFRTEAEVGSIRVWECDEAHWYQALWARAHGVESQLTTVGVGSSLASLNPEIREVMDPHSQAPALAVKALPIELALLACEAVETTTGSGRFAAYPFGDLAIFHASETAYLQGETEISLDELASDPQRVLLHGVDEVVEAPGGVEPFGHAGIHDPDRERIGRFIEAGHSWRDGDHRPAYQQLERFMEGQVLGS